MPHGGSPSTSSSLRITRNMRGANLWYVDVAACYLSFYIVSHLCSIISFAKSSFRNLFHKNFFDSLSRAPFPPRFLFFLSKNYDISRASKLVCKLFSSKLSLVGANKKSGILRILIQFRLVWLFPLLFAKNLHLALVGENPLPVGRRLEAQFFGAPEIC